VKWKLTSVHLELVFIAVQYRCTVWEECTVAQKSLWVHLMDLLGDAGHVEACFGSIGNSVNLGARQVHGSLNVPTGTEIFLATPEGPPR
jgi:hypothetical protein